jgi:hypothetical protein
VLKPSRRDLLIDLLHEVSSESSGSDSGAKDRSRRAIVHKMKSVESPQRERRGGSESRERYPDYQEDVCRSFTCYYS